MSKFIVREQIKQWGWYAAVDVMAETDTLSTSEMIFDYKGPTEWQVPSKMAALTFYDYFKRRKSGRLVIRIENIDWLPIDTNNIIVFFSVIQALCKELNFNIEGLSLDKGKEIFIFPEPRSI